MDRHGAQGLQGARTYVRKGTQDLGGGPTDDEIVVIEPGGHLVVDTGGLKGA
jgi:hypothetical protein